MAWGTGEGLRYIHPGAYNNPYLTHTQCRMESDRGHFLSQAKVGGLMASTNHMAVGVMPNLWTGLTFGSERHPHVRAKFACDCPAVTRGIIPCFGDGCALDLA
jgi:hypothetical protein